MSGFALGVVTTALVVLMLSPEMSTPEVEETAAVQDVHKQGAQGSLEGSQPSAAAPSDPSAALQPTAAGEGLQPTAAAEPAAAEQPQPGPALAASAPGTETTPSAATAAPDEPARPQAADAPATKLAGAKQTQALAAPAAPAAQARGAQPVAAAAKPAAAVAAPPAKPEPPVDPNSQDAKLAAAAVVRQNAGTPIDSMLDQAFSPGAKADKPSAGPSAATPPTPTRDDVIKAMSVLIPAIRGCAQGQSGMAPVSIVVQSDGRVESAGLSSGPFQGTASGRCMEGVVRRARFPRFSQPSFRVQFPFSIQ